MIKNTIVLITDLITIGGTKTYIESIAKQAKNNKQKLILITFIYNENDSNFNYDNVSNNIKISINNPGFMFLYQRVIKLLPIIKKIIKNEPNAIIISDLILAATAILVSKNILGIKNKLFYQFHGLDTLEKESKAKYENYNKKLSFQVKQKIRRTIENHTLSKVNKILCFSNYSKETLTKYINKPSEIVVIKPGIDKELDSFVKNINKNQAKIKLGFPTKMKILLFVGRLEPRKGAFELLTEISKIPTSKFKKLRVVFASDFSDTHFSSMFFKMHKKVSLEQNIIFVNNPNRVNLALLYKSSDFLIMPSTELETFGLVTLEALTCNTLTIGFNIGANKDLIHQKLLVNPNDGMKKLVEIMISTNSQKIPKKFIYEKLAEYNWANYLEKIQKI